MSGFRLNLLSVKQLTITSTECTSRLTHTHTHTDNDFLPIQMCLQLKHITQQQRRSSRKLDEEEVSHQDVMYFVLDAALASRRPPSLFSPFVRLGSPAPVLCRAARPTCSCQLSSCSPSKKTHTHTDAQRRSCESQQRTRN